MSLSRITFDSWIDQGTKLYGEDRSTWKFRCPICKIEQTIALWREHTKLSDDEIRQRIAGNCIGRFAPGGRKGKASIGCDYTVAGLFDLAAYRVYDNARFYSIFGFADGELLPDEDPLKYDNLDALIEATGEAESVVWPEWVSESIREQIGSFWSQFGRTPKAYFESWKSNMAPDFDTEPALMERGKEVKGRFIYAWNNMGRSVQPDGTHITVSF